MSEFSSIHVKAVKSGSERHNEREQDLDYVRKDLTHENESFKLMPIAEARLSIENRYRASTGQKMQAKATPIKEGVLLISTQHGIEDLKILAEKLEYRFGIKTIQAYTHKDEGHYDKVTKEWKPNYHAHMVFDWTDQGTGKNLKLSREDMSEMQTIVADSLGLKRGVKSSKKHIDAMSFKANEMEKDLEKVYKVQNVLPKAIEVIKQAKGLQEQIKTLEGSKNDIQMQINDNSQHLERLRNELKEKEKQAKELAELEKQYKEIEQKTAIAKFDLEYISDKTAKAKIELEKVIPPKQEQKEEIKITQKQGMRL